MMKQLPALALVVFAAFVAGACEKEGPAEKAGKEIDHAYSEAKEKAEEAGEKIEQAGEKIEEALDEAEGAVKGD